jgi:hypothetical protein
MKTFLIVLDVIAVSWRPGAMRTAEPGNAGLQGEPADKRAEGI